MKTKMDGYTLHFNSDAEAKDALFNKLLDFFMEHEAYCGESICQSDAPQLAAPELLSEIAEDIFEFETIYDDEE